MENPMVAVETAKGIWAILLAITTGLITWIGWTIKDNKAKKKSEQDYRNSQIERTIALDAKLDKMIEWQIDFAKDQNSRLKVISEGLDLSMEDDKLIFQAFRKSKLLNGDSELQSKKLEEYQKSLIKSAYLFEEGDEEIEKLENLTK